MAPELLSHDKANTEKADVYAFGVIMYYILTRGERPRYFLSHEYNQLHHSGYLNDLSRSIIRECWHFDYYLRPSFEEILQKITQNNFMLIDGIETKIPQLKEHLGLY